MRKYLAQFFQVSNRKNGVVSGTVKPKEDWVSEETRDKFKKDEVVAVDENEEINLNDIPF